MRVLFLGNHTVGTRTLAAIAETETVAGVVAHPEDPEDGVRYESVYELARSRGWKALRGGGGDPKVDEFIRQAKPDLLWITDFRYLLPEPLLNIAPLGVVNLHPSLLPKYRGRAPINWAILKGETTLGLTAHYVDSGMDTGDIIAQESYELSQEQDVGDALQILYPLYTKVTRFVLGCFHSGKVPRRPQDASQGTAFPARKPRDGRIDWTLPTKSVWNMIRAVAFPYPGAFTTAGDRVVLVWKAGPSPLAPSCARVPGEVIRVDSQGIHIQCGDGVLCVQSEFPDGISQNALQEGTILGVQQDMRTKEYA